MKEKFTIRPKPKKEESLTSYLCRIAYRNQIEYLDIWKLINTGTKFKLSNTYGYRLDIIPHDVIDTLTLSMLLGTSKKDIESMTFYPIITKFFDNQVSAGKGYRYAMNKLVTMEKRKFCPKCLKEQKIFKLIWQAREIEICDFHYVSLMSVCSICLKEQPYISNSLACCVCQHCQSALYKSNNEVIINEDFIIDQLQKYEDWRYILDPTTELVSENEIEGLTKEKTLAMKFLFVAQEQQSRLKYNSVRHISFIQAVNLGKVMYGKKKAILSDFFHVLRAEQLTVEQFVKIRVLPSYVQSFIDKLQEVVPSSCLTPWCAERGKINSMIELYGEGKYLKGRQSYSSSWICTSCFMRYGYRWKNKQWENIAGEIQIYNTVKNYLELGLTKNTIKGDLKTSLNRVNQIMGYLLYHNLLPEHLIAKYKPKVESNLIVEHFDEIATFARDHRAMYKVARSLFNWNQLTFYYFFSSVEVQQLLLKVFSKRKVSPQRKEKRKGEAQVVINEMVQNNVAVTVKELAAALDVDSGTLIYHGINVIAKEIIQDQREAKLEQDQVKLRNEANEYIMLKKSKKEPIYAKEVYKELSCSIHYIYDNFPELFKWISGEVKSDKIYQNQLKDQSIMALMRNAIDELLKEGEQATAKAVSSKMKLGFHINSRRRYQNIYNILKAELNLL